MRKIITTYIVQYTDLHHTVEGNPKTRQFDTEQEAKRFVDKELKFNDDIKGITLTLQTSTIERETI